MTVIVIFDDVDVTPDVDDYTIAIFINRHKGRTNKYRYLQRKYTNRINITINTDIHEQLAEDVAVAIAKLFANPKEQIIVYRDKKCIVY